jgi:hypothetical protein
MACCQWWVNPELGKDLGGSQCFGILGVTKRALQ